jgi:hypothetical protein
MTKRSEASKAKQARSPAFHADRIAKRISDTIVAYCAAGKNAKEVSNQDIMGALAAYSATFLFQVEGTAAGAYVQSDRLNNAVKATILGIGQARAAAATVPQTSNLSKPAMAANGRARAH